MKRVLLLVAVVLSFSAAPAVAAPSPGSSGLGDRLFPQLGNGGYDVQHYKLSAFAISLMLGITFGTLAARFAGTWADVHGGRGRTTAL